VTNDAVAAAGGILQLPAGQFGYLYATVGCTGLQGSFDFAQDDKGQARDGAYLRRWQVLPG
jgi:hypothetical protein